ncbi:MAG: hypothetical protein KDK78_06185, partial [Chlamydiia bacterium]|nr:hypothetical protein [Chlamydiia bacterium]
MQRLVAKSFGFLCLCLLAAALLAGVLVQTGPVKRRLVAHFLDQIQEATGHEVSVKHVRIILPFQLHAEGVRIRVEGADWLEVDKMSATWQPMKLYWNTVSIRDLRLDGVHLLRIPSPRESVTELAGETEEGKGQIGRQLDFEIQAFQLNRCNLKALPGATDLALVDLRGQLQWFPSENRTDLRIQATDSFLFSGSSRIRIQGQLEKEIYVLQAHLSESAAGPLSTALHLPGYPSADARMRIQGTAEDWGHCLGDFDLGGAHALTGNFEIKSYGFFAAMPQLETFFGQDLGTRGTFAYFSDGSLHVDRLQGSNSKIDYMGWLRFQDGFTLREADADIRFIDLAPFEDYLGLQLAGIVEGRLRYRGMPQARELSLQIASEHLKLEGFDVTDLSSTFVTKSPVDQNLQGLFLLDFRFEGVPVFFSTDLQQRDAKQWTCSGVELDLGPTALAGELEVDLTGPGISGRLNGKNQDLFGWS